MDSTCFLDKESSDVQLRIHTTDQDSKAVVPGHSKVLRQASKVFNTMLQSGNFKEGQTGIVDLEVKGNMDDAFCFLRYLYTKDLEQVDMNVYITVLQTAHLYGVEDLVQLCKERITEQLRPQTVCRAYVSLKYVAASVGLLDHFRDLILNFAFLIFKENLHLTLDEEMMVFLIDSNKLNILNEDQALRALWYWGCAQFALKTCSEKSVEMAIEKISVFIRRPLLSNESQGFPWSRFWKDLMSGTERRESNSSRNIGDLTRKPNLNPKLNKFSKVARLSQINIKTNKTPLKNTNFLMVFSLNQNILFSGFTIQVTVYEILSSQDIFQFSINQKNVTQLGSPEMVLTNESSYPKAPVGFAPNDLGHVMSSFIVGQIVRSSASNESQTKEKHSYIYDLTVNLRTPMVLETAETIIINLNIKEMPKFEVSLTNFMFPENHTLDFNQSLKIRLWQEMVGVTQLYYFV